MKKKRFSHELLVAAGFVVLSMWAIWSMFSKYTQQSLHVYVPAQDLVIFDWPNKYILTKQNF